MRRRVLWVAALALPGLGASAGAACAQAPPPPAPPPPRVTLVTTDRLASWERAVRVELSLGRQLSGGGGANDGSATVTQTAVAAVRFRSPGSTGIRLLGLWARRDGGYKPRADFLVLGAATDVPIQVGRRVALAPSFGAGAAVSIRQQANPPPGTYAESEEQFSLLLGLSLRTGRFVFEGHFVVLGGDTFLPFTVGIRL